MHLHKRRNIHKEQFLQPSKNIGNFPISSSFFLIQHKRYLFKKNVDLTGSSLFFYLIFIIFVNKLKFKQIQIRTAFSKVEIPVKCLIFSYSYWNLLKESFLFRRPYQYKRNLYIGGQKKEKLVYNDWESIKELEERILFYFY